MLGIADRIISFFGVGLLGRIRFIMVAGILIGLTGIVLGISRGRTIDWLSGAVILVSSAVFWPWLIRTGRRKGTI